jgi:HAE1 family hydrophobic/amphiphilic exporter-1
MFEALKATLSVAVLLLSHQLAASAQAARFTIQIAALSQESEAQALATRLVANGLPAYLLTTETPVRYRVRFGAYASRAAAKAQADNAVRRQLISEYLIAPYVTPPRKTAVQPPSVLSPATNAPVVETPVNTPPPPDPMPTPKVADATALSQPRPVPTRTGGRIVRWSLRDALQAALEKNVDIEIERSQVRLASYDVRAAEGVYDRVSSVGVSYDALTAANTRLFSGTNADRTESGSFSFSHGLRQSLRSGGTLQFDFDNERNTNNFATLSPLYNPRLGFTITQPLLRNFKIDSFRRQIRLAKKRQDLADAIFRQRVIEIVAQTQLAYWNLALAYKNEEVQRDSVKLAEEQLRINQRQVELGASSELEVVQAASALETRRQQVFQAIESVIAAENTLKSLTIGASGDELAAAQIQPVEPFAGLTKPLPFADAFSLAKTQRPELKQLALQQDSNRIDQDFFRNQLKPQVDLVAGYSLIGVAGAKNSGLVSVPPTCVSVNPPDTPGCIPPAFLGNYPNALRNLVRNDFRRWQAGVNISFPWGNRVNEANLGRAREQERQLDLQTRQALRNIELEVRYATQTLDTIKQRLDAARVAADYTRQQLEGEQKKFTAGLSTTFLVLQRQTELAFARAAELQALADYHRGIAQLQRVIGATLSDNGIEIQSELQPALKKP